MKEKYTEDDICEALKQAEQMTMKHFKFLEDEIEDKVAFRIAMHGTLEVFTEHFAQVIKNEEK